MNHQLNKEYTTEEIERALKQMAPIKSPEPDGFGACFYHKHWSTVGKDAYNAVLDILQGECMLSPINSTFIALILKNDNFVLVSDYRLISMCNVVYKMVSKVTCNRLKNFMPHIISRIQSFFILDRLITNNIIVAYKLLHSMKLNTKRGRDK